jgi:hypothetical protein
MVEQLTKDIRNKDLKIVELIEKLRQADILNQQNLKII